MKYSITEKWQQKYNLRAFGLISFICLSGMGPGSCTQMPDRFNCVESGADPINGSVYTKISGATTSLDMIGIKSNALLTGLAANTLNNVTFQIVDATSGASCATLPTLSTVTTTINFPAGSARLPYSFTLPNVASKKAQCRIIHADVGTSCSSDSFAIRPQHLVFDSSVADAGRTTQTANNTPIVKAGQNFAIKFSSFEGSLGARTYNGIPKINPVYMTSGALNANFANLVQAHPDTPNKGQFDLVTSVVSGFPTAVSGDSVLDFKYSEVGYFRLLGGTNILGVFQPALIDDTFTAIDAATGGCVANSYSNTPVGGKVGCLVSSGQTNVSKQDSIYFGRFIPNAFKATPTLVTEGCDAGNFTYFGGRLTSQFTLEAVNSSNVRTQNYTGNYAKFKNTVPATLATYSTTFASYGVQNAAIVNPVSTLKFIQSASPTVVSDWTNGVATIRLALQAKTLNPNPALADLDRPLNTTFAQSVNIAAMPTDGEATTTTATNIVNNTEFRYGRLSVANAYGAETMPLTFDVLAQHFDNAGKWVTNSLDNCTQIAANTFPMTFEVSAANNLTLGETLLTKVTDFSAGKAKYKLSTPGHGNNGWVLINTPTLTEFGGTKQMRASFGQYKSSLIYSREN